MVEVVARAGTSAIKVLVVWNASDRRCGFANYGYQTVEAFRRTPGVDVTPWDGTYQACCERGSFFPPDVESYDVVHLIWHAMTLNHYTGVTQWPSRPVLSWWNGGPSDASCPFEQVFQVKWSEWPRPEDPTYSHVDYPVVDWVTDLPAPASAFTVGTSSVRGDGVAAIREVCEKRGWAMNLPTAGAWIPLEDEIRRLARSTVNVCWYNSDAHWQSRSGAASTMLAARRPLLITRDALLTHLWEASDVWVSPEGSTEYLDMCLCGIKRLSENDTLYVPNRTFDRLSWTRATRTFLSRWQEALRP